MPAWLLLTLICLWLIGFWVAVGMVLLVFTPNPLLLIVALVCLMAAAGIEFTETEEGD